MFLVLNRFDPAVWPNRFYPPWIGALLHTGIRATADTIPLVSRHSTRAPACPVPRGSYSTAACSCRLYAQRACPTAAVLCSELRRLFRWLKYKGVTAILTGERGDGTLTRHGLEEYVSDCADRAGQNAEKMALETADKPYRLLVEQVPHGAATLTADGAILSCNRGFQRWQGKI